MAPFYGGEAGVSRRLERARDALAEFRRSGTLRMVPAYAAGDERAGMSFEMDSQSDFYDVPEYVNTAADRAAAWFEETL